jgi:hypothetical protein
MSVLFNGVVKRMPKTDNTGAILGSHLRKLFSNKALSPSNQSPGSRRLPLSCWTCGRASRRVLARRGPRGPSWIHHKGLMYRVRLYGLHVGPYFMSTMEEHFQIDKSLLSLGLVSGVIAPVSVRPCIARGHFLFHPLFED